MKKTLCILIVCLLTLSFCPMAAAAPAEKPEFEIVDGTLYGYHGPGGSVTIPDGVTAIEASAMSNKDSLTEVVIPPSVQYIGINAFGESKNLKTVTLSEGLLMIDGFAFERCTALESIRIPDSVLFINEFAFQGCSSLTDVHLPATAETAGRSAPLFVNTPWGEQNTVTINEPMPTAGGGKWSYTTVAPAEPSKAENGFLMRGDMVVGFDGEVSGELVIPEGVTAIAPHAFAGNTGITTVKLPDSIRIIGASAFENCTALQRVEPELPEAVLAILSNAFAGCTSLEFIDVPFSTYESRGTFEGTIFEQGGFPMAENAFAPRRSYDERFRDVPKKVWYHDSVAKAYASGILDGITEERYEPEKLLTVAEAVKIAAVIHAVGRDKMELLPASSPWYQTYFHYYNRRGPFSFLEGVNPSRPIRRDEFASLARYTLPASALPVRIGGESIFKDVSGGNPYWGDIYKLYANGILSGYSDGGFHPAGGLTRGEIAAIISRLMYPEMRLQPKK